MSRLRDQSGQSIVYFVVFLTALLGMTAAVLDVGAWFRADRATQAMADAAALAGAQELPESTSAARSLALQYAAKNGGSIAGTKVTFESRVLSNDTIVVEATRPAPGIFTRLFGITSVDVHAKAKARAGKISSAMWVAPIVVNEKHPMLVCKPLPCFGQQTELDYYHLKTSTKDGEHSDAAGSFGFINLVGNGNPGTSELRQWILSGFDKYMDLGSYNARTGNPFSSIQDALDARLGEEMLFPVYRSIKGPGSNATYQIVGWVGFVITSMELKGNNEKFFGYFTRVIWEGIMSETGSEADFGVRTVALVE